jgi:hypothetical protein
MTGLKVEGWSGGEAGAEGLLPIDPDAGVHHARIPATEKGTLRLTLRSPRPFRLWIENVLLLDEGLSWRDFQREVMAAAAWPTTGGPLALRVEFGERPRHPAFVDDSCPSRNRTAVMAAVERLHPDGLELRMELAPPGGPAAGVRFQPTQFWRDGVLWQHLIVRSAESPPPPSTQSSQPADQPSAFIGVRSETLPFDAVDATKPEERARGVQRFHVPVCERADLPLPLRSAGEPEQRPEPSRAVAGRRRLTLWGLDGEVTLDMPVFEPLGRDAPRHEYAPAAWPTPERLLKAAPAPLLPSALAYLKPVYDEAWTMLLRLTRTADPASGLPADYISTGTNFAESQFVWDTCFTAMSAAYGHRALPATGSMDVLYSRQFDGGYLHRQHDVRDGSPMLFEPDFSPNPPLLTIAEWQVARVTGDVLRLKRLYPALVAQHRWLQANRRLPDGTYWTTGLASGLDNSPSSGDAYPDLTAQMADDAGALALIAEAIGRAEEAVAWRAERAEIAAALNARCWNEEGEFYATGLEGGGHNPEKIVTAFWPLFAGVAPADRAELMARHAEDPASFGRHHPLPSLAADSPVYDSGGSYWLGSVWPPTNYVAITGLARAGHRDLARRLALRHLEVVAEVFRDTGRLWENYGADASRPGSWSGPDYSWSALGPISLLLEVVLGLEPNALDRRLEWRPPLGETSGVKNYPLGPASVSLFARAYRGRLMIDVSTDAPFTLVAYGAQGRVETFCPPGATRLML